MQPAGKEVEDCANKSGFILYLFILSVKKNHVFFKKKILKISTFMVTGARGEISTCWFDEKLNWC